MNTQNDPVSIVGAGPGDPDLLTVKARRRIDGADVILLDSLVGPAVVESLPGTARVVDVGKRPNGERTTQDEINDMLVREARAGRSVVRLKGGDPYVFGRGGEEAEFLARHDVPFEVVPGITSAIAGPGAAGIPITHREHASSLTVITGHEDPLKEESALDWEALARQVVAGGTLVILMGVGKLPRNAAALREHGVPAETPFAMDERATLPEETAVTGTLDTIAAEADEADVRPPAVTVVGDVVQVRDSVANWLDASGVSPWRAAEADAAGPVGAEVDRGP